MTAVERRALYNLLRMHWLADPQIVVEPWQIEDYRLLPLPQIFTRLQNFSILLNGTSFKAYADQCDSPEDLTDYLLGDRPVQPEIEDQIYLLLFELWRRLVNEKPCFSIFCDELDHLIYQYDNAQLNTPTGIQDAVAELLSILNENVDAGIEPKDALKRISDYCANDLETFLYDFISEQIDIDHESYAHELLDGFTIFLGENKWFLLLRAKHVGQTNAKLANKLLANLIENHTDDSDLEFNLELLSLMSIVGMPLLFQKLVEQTIPLVNTEEDFQDLLTICIDYYQRLDEEKIEQKLLNFLQKRSSKLLTTSLNPNDASVKQFLEIINA